MSASVWATMTDKDGAATSHLLQAKKVGHGLGPAPWKHVRVQHCNVPALLQGLSSQQALKDLRGALNDKKL
eukprot:1153616-Pleurochrysis_carterae.AAC.1